MLSKTNVRQSAKNRRVRKDRSDLREGSFRNALKLFDHLLEQNPSDAEALRGRAQADYYAGRLREAYEIAAKLVNENPNNFDDVFLLANVERARRDRRGALALLDQADRLSPANPEVEEMRDKVEWPFTLHTTASFAREIGHPGPADLAALSSEDLRTFSYGTTLEMAAIGRSDSFFSLKYLPLSSPSGGIRGAAAPAEFTYRQATRVFSFLTVRGGAGLVRFGPGAPENIPGQPAPVSTATIRPVGFAGISLAPRSDFSLDLVWSRSAIDSTPLSVRLGVVESRREPTVSQLVTIFGCDPALMPAGRRTQTNMPPAGVFHSTPSGMSCCIAPSMASRIGRAASFCRRSFAERSD